jgi:hypothetical protein
MHTIDYLLDDHPGVVGADNSLTTSGWPNVMTQKKQTACTNAESLAMLGYWAMLADKGFTMDRRWDFIPGDLHDDSDEAKQYGTEDYEVGMPEPPALSRDAGRKWDPTHPDNDAVKGVVWTYSDVTW